jgi:superfamily II helicase
VHPQQSPQKKKIKKKSKKSSAIFPFEALTLNKSEKSIYYNNNNNNYNNSRKKYNVSQDISPICAYILKELIKL